MPTSDSDKWSEENKIEYSGNKGQEVGGGTTLNGVVKEGLWAEETIELSIEWWSQSCWEEYSKLRGGQLHTPRGRRKLGCWRKFIKPVLTEWGEGEDTNIRGGQDRIRPECVGINTCPVLLTLI